jgi:hypothetical protein
LRRSSGELRVLLCLREQRFYAVIVAASASHRGHVREHDGTPLMIIRRQRGERCDEQSLGDSARYRARGAQNLFAKSVQHIAAAVGTRELDGACKMLLEARLARRAFATRKLA